MKKEKDRPDPSRNDVRDTFKQHYAGTFVAKRKPSENDSVNTDKTTTQAKKNVQEFEEFMRVWEFVKNPQHASAIMAMFTVLIFFATVAYAVVALFQWGALRDANQINHDALVTIQRPFVHFSPNVNTLRTLFETQDNIQFSVPMENAGATQTAEMFNHVSWCFVKDKLPDDFSFPDLGNLERVPTVLAPKEKTWTVPLSFPLSDITTKLKAGRRLYLYGWATYQDVLPNPAQHITRFCYQMAQLGFDKSTGYPSSTFVLCPRGNCTEDDKECQKYGSPKHESVCD